MKTKTALLMVVVMALTSCSISKTAPNETSTVKSASTTVENTSDDVAQTLDDDTTEEETSDGVTQTLDGDTEEIYGYIACIDWPIYKSTKELADKSDIVVIGRVTDISFQVLDDKTGLPPTEKSEGSYCRLATVYSIDVIIVCKGEASELSDLKIRVEGGLQDVYVEEQLAALDLYDNAKRIIYIANGKPEIHIGEAYLFSLSQYGDTLPTVINFFQGVLELNEPTKRDEYGYLMPQNIIYYFGKDKWKEFKNLFT